MVMCSIEGCPNGAKPGGVWCITHYMRWYRTGDVQAEKPVVKRRHGSRPCAVQDCVTVISRGTYCRKHQARLERNGDPTKLKGPRPQRGSDNPAWKGDAVGYGSAHERVRRERGLASELRCVDCGGGAAQWSYRHGCEGERVSEVGPYCPHPDCYDPRCVPCHKRFDLDR